MHCVYVIFQKILQLIKWKSGLKGSVKCFSVGFNLIDSNDILNTQK